MDFPAYLFLQIAVQPPDGTEPEDYPLPFQSGLLSLLASFQHYFQSEQADPFRDMPSHTTSTLLLTDEDFMELLQKIRSLYQEVLSNPPDNRSVPADTPAPSFSGALLLLALPAAFILYTAVLGLSIDLCFPVFDWPSETTAVKQSASVLLTMLASFASFC